MSQEDVKYYEKTFIVNHGCVFIQMLFESKYAKDMHNAHTVLEVVHMYYISFSIKRQVFSKMGYITKMGLRRRSPGCAKFVELTMLINFIIRGSEMCRVVGL